MINYKMKKSDINYYVKVKFLFRISPTLIIFVGMALALIYFLIMGFFVDKEAFEDTHLLITFLILYIIVYSIHYTQINTNTTNAFNNCAKNGEIEYTFSRNGDLFELEDLTNNKKFNFKVCDLIKVKKYKKIIMLKLNSVSVGLPNIDEANNWVNIALPNIKEIEDLLVQA